MARTYHRRGPEQWQQLIKEQAKSGISIAAFCKQHQIAPSNFYHWRARIAKNSATEKVQSADFVSVPVENRSPTPISSDVEITLTLPCGVGLIIRSL